MSVSLLGNAKLESETSWSWLATTVDAGVIAPDTNPSGGPIGMIVGDPLILDTLARSTAKFKIGSTKENVTHSHKLTPSSGEQRLFFGDCSAYQLIARIKAKKN